MDSYLTTNQLLIEPVIKSDQSKIKPDIPDQIIAKWQKLIDLASELIGVPAGLIMKVYPKEIEVFVCSETKGNPYEKGERARLKTGLYCETVMCMRKQLLVPDACKDPNWDHNPDIELGMVSYFGLPLIWPDNEIFGTICVLDDKENHYSVMYQKLCTQFKEAIEADLHMILESEDSRKQTLEELISVNRQLMANEQQLQIEITERKQVEKEVLLEKEFTDQAINAQVDTFFLFEPVTGIALRWNDSFRDISGYSDEEIATLPALTTYYGSDDLERAGVFIKKVLKEGSGTIDLELICKDGRKVPMEYRVSVINDEQGNAKYMISIGRDITERKRMEKELQNTQMQYTDFINSSSDVVTYWKMPDGLKIDLPIEKQIEMIVECVCVDSNQRAWQVYGFNRKNELIGKKYKELVKDETSPELFELFIKNNYQINDREYHEILKSGIELYSLENWYGVIENGVFTHLWASSKDITEQKKAEIELKSSEEKYSSVVENSNDGIVIIKDEKIAYVNAAVKNLLGFKPNDIMGRNVAELVAQKYRELVTQRFRDRLSGKKVPSIYEISLVRKDGSLIPVEINVTLMNFEGESAGLVFLRDITERKKAQEELKASEKQYRLLIDHIPDVTWSTDANGRTNFISSNVKDVYGYTPEEIFNGGEKLWFGRVHKDDLQKLKNAYKAFFEDNKEFDIEYRIKHKNGQWIWLHDRAIMHFEKDQKQYAYGVFSDITERIQAEENLMSQKKYIDDLINTLPDTFYIFDPESGNGIQWNETLNEISGYDYEEMSEYPPLHFYPPEEHQSIEDAVNTTLEKGRATVELSYICADGSRIPFEYSTVFIKDPDGNPRICAIGRDITERKRVESEREQALMEAQNANNVKDLFLANMSHEIRTPLNSILGFTEIIEESFKSRMEEHEHEYFQIVNNSGQRLIKTVHSILDISQIEAGTIPFEPKTIRLATSIEMVYKELKPLAEEKNLEITYNNQISDGAVNADESSLVKAVSNLVENAIIYTNEGQINIQLDEQNSKYVLSISDTGIGIGVDYLNHLYDAFSQESNGYTKKYQGMGLGLSIAKSCLDMNDIPIEVESKKGVGTTFRLSFSPTDAVVDETDVQVIKVETEIEKTVSQERPVILLVEDDENNRKTLEALLSKKYETPYAVSVSEAKQQLRDYKVDLMLLDLSLEGDRDGLDLVAYMKTKKRLKEIPIIAVTAHAFTTDRDNVLNAGCDDYMSKPINVQKLQDMVGQYLA